MLLTRSVGHSGFPRGHRYLQGPLKASWGHQGQPGGDQDKREAVRTSGDTVETTLMLFHRDSDDRGPLSGPCSCIATCFAPERTPVQCPPWSCPQGSGLCSHNEHQRVYTCVTLPTWRVSVAAGTGHGPLGLTLPGPHRTLLLWRLQVPGAGRTGNHRAGSLQSPRPACLLYSACGSWSHTRSGSVWGPHPCARYREEGSFRIIMMKILHRVSV